MTAVALLALPLSFEVGPGPREVTVHGARIPVRLTSRSVDVAGERAFELAGAASVRAEPIGPKTAFINRILGRDRSRWQLGVPVFRRVRFRDVWPGVDVEWHGDRGALEYDVVVRGKAPPLKLTFSATRPPRADGADVVFSQGRLRSLRAEQDGREISARFEVKGAEVAVRLGPYDATRPLRIDPTLDFSTYLGGNLDEHSEAIAADLAGNSYVAGATLSANFPTRNAAQPTLNAPPDGCISRIAADGTLMWSTYLGGSGSDDATGVAVDTNGNVIVSGFTNSADFPLAMTFAGAFDAWVAWLGGDSGVLQHVTLIGGSNTDWGYGLAVAATGAVIVTGFTDSTDFPVMAPMQSMFGGGSDGFLTRLSPTGAIVWSSYFGGTGNDYGHRVVIARGNFCVVGRTSSIGLVMGAAQPTYGGGLYDGFVGCFDQLTTTLLWATYVGGNDDDRANGVVLAPDDSVYVAGRTLSTDFPTRSPLQPASGGQGDAFVMHFSPTGQLLWSTYLGGSGDDGAYALGMDGHGALQIAGWTTSGPSLPSIAPLQAGLRGARDGLLATMSKDGSTLRFCSWFGGTGDEQIYDLAIDGRDRVHVIGESGSADLPLALPFQSSIDGGYDLFVARVFSDAGPLDAGPPDAGPPDAGPPDAGPPDAGPPDAGPPDAGPPDAGPPDAGPSDAGPDDGGTTPRLMNVACACNSTQPAFTAALLALWLRRWRSRRPSPCSRRAPT